MSRAFVNEDAGGGLRARELAAEAGLALVEDEGLVEVRGRSGRRREPLQGAVRLLEQPAAHLSLELS